MSNAVSRASRMRAGASVNTRRRWGSRSSRDEVIVGGGVGLEGCELGFGGGALGVQVGVAGADAGAVGLGGRVGGVGGLFQFGDQAVLGGVDAGQLGAQVCLLPGAGFGVLGGGGGELGGEELGAVVPEYVLVEESGDGVHEDVFAEHDVSVVGVGGGLAGVGGVVRALVVGVGGAAAGLPAGAAHAPLAGVVPDAGPQDIPAALPGGRGLGVADVAAFGSDLLGGVPVWPVDDGGVGGLG